MNPIILDRLWLLGFFITAITVIVGGISIITKHLLG